VRLWMLGTNHERASIEVRERLAFGNDDLGDGVRQLGAVAHEGVILSTCNRTEIYGLFDSDADGGEELRQFLVGARDLSASVVAATTYLHADTDAVRHLYRVSCGLDSMLLGEPQILTQVQDALATARELAAAGPVLTRLYTDALRVGKLARTTTGIARNRLSIAHAAIDLAIRELGTLAGRRVVLLGAGEIGTIAARVLRTANTADLVIVNRSASRGQALAAAVEGRFVALAGMADELADAAVVFSAVSTPDFILSQDILPILRGRRGAPLLVVDLGVPRTVDPALADHPNIRLRTVDDLEQIADSARRSYDGEVVRVEQLIDQAVDHFDEWLGTRRAVPTIRALQEHAEEIREAELERALRRLGHLSERDREVVRALSVGIVGKMFHQPLVTLRSAAANGHYESTARTAAELFGLPMPSDDPAD